MLGQEVQRKLDQEATDFAQLLLSSCQIGLGQTRPGLELLQLGHVSHQGGRKALKYLQQNIFTEDHVFSILRMVENRWTSKQLNTVLLPHVKLICPLYLLINGRISTSCCNPHLLVETVTDGVRQVDAGVSVASEDSSAQKTKTFQ